MTQQKAIVRVVSQPTGGALVAQVFGDERTRIIKEQLAPGISDAELQYFAAVCQRTGLDPFGKPAQIYAIMRWDSKARREKLTIQPSVDGLRLIAARSKRYGGQTAPQWCGPDREWLDFWDDEKPPVAARIGVYIIGAREPTYAVATYRSYAQMKDGKPLSKWAEMPDVMLATAAERLALRKAFPHELAAQLADVGIEDAEPTPDVTIDTTATVTSTPRLVRAHDGDEPRRAFWAKAQAMAAEYGFLGPDGKFKKSLVHQALGFAPTEGAITAWLDEGHSWPELIGLLESLPPPGGEPPAEPTEAEIEGADGICPDCGYALSECSCAEFVGAAGPKEEPRQAEMVAASRPYHP